MDPNSIIRNYGSQLNYSEIRILLSYSEKRSHLNYSEIKIPTQLFGNKDPNSIIRKKRSQLNYSEIRILTQLFGRKDPISIIRIPIQSFGNENSIQSESEINNQGPEINLQGPEINI